jgi:hypothetical protein
VLTARRARSSLRRSWPRTGVVPTLCALLACAPASAAAPAPDPPPSQLQPDPPPEAVTTPAPARSSAPPPAVAIVRPAAPAVTASPPAPSPQPHRRPRPQAAAKAKPVSTPRAAGTVRIPRDSAPMPRTAATPAAELLEPGRLALAGVVLAFVALGGAIVLGAGHRAMTGARA